MADYNSVPLGQAGTGAAFILGEDTASANFNRNLANLNAIQNQRRLEAQQKAQQLAKSYRDNLLAASDGKLFANELGQLEQQHLKQGMDYRGQGFDIYNPDPNDKGQLDASNQYMSDRRMIENLRAYRKGIEDNYKTNSTKLSEAKNGEYNAQDIQNMNDFVSKGSLVDYYNSGATLPSISKNFNMSEALKGIKVPTFEKAETKNGVISDRKYIDKQEAEDTVLGVLNNTVGGQQQLAKVTQGMPIAEVRRLPSSLEDIKKDVIKDAYGDPQIKQALATAQIRVGTPAFDKWVDGEAKRLHGIKRGFDDVLNNGVSQISNGVALFDKKKNEMTEYQRQQLALAKQREARLASGKGTDEDVLYRQQLIEDMLGGVEGSGEKVNAIVKATSGYKNKGLNYSFKGNVLDINVPERVIETQDGEGEVKTKVIPARTIRIDKSNPVAARTALNTALNEITGEKVSESKYQTGQPSGKIKGSTVSDRTKGKSLPQKTSKFKGVPNGGF